MATALRGGAETKLVSGHFRMVIIFEIQSTCAWAMTASLRTESAVFLLGDRYEVKWLLRYNEICYIAKKKKRIHMVFDGVQRRRQ